MSLGSADSIAKVKLAVPAAYGIDLGKPPGTVLGYVSTVLYDVAGSASPAFADGELMVADPAKYLSDPQAQACAPGSHNSVWHSTLSVLGQRFDLSVFVDLGGSTDLGPAALVLTMCPAWPAQGLPRGVTAGQLTFFVEGVMTSPTAPGRYTWSAIVAPPVAGSLAPDPTRAFELRSTIPHPHTLTLRARHDAKTKTVELSGKLTAVGVPQAGVEISFGASTDSLSELTFFGPVTTNATGEFSIRRQIDRSMQFTASVDSAIGPCKEPSSAPAGCPSETVSPPPSASTIVRVREPTDPRLVARARDQAFARRINLKLGDFPPGWEAFDAFPVFSCSGFKPKLSDLTVTGDFESRAFANDQGVVSSQASIYLTEEQARTAFARKARLAGARCFAKQLSEIGLTVRQLGALAFPALGSETRAFRVVASDVQNVVTIDLVSFRRGRAVVHMGFASLVQPLLIAHELAAKVAARARGV